MVVLTAVLSLSVCEQCPPSRLVLNHNNAACGQSADLRIGVSLFSTKHAIALSLVRRDIPRAPAVAGLWLVSKRRRQPAVSKSMQSSSGAFSSDGSNVSSLVSFPLQQT